MTLIEKIKKLVWYNSPSKLKEILLEISGSTFNPSEHDLDEFLNESANPYVRQDELGSGGGDFIPLSGTTEGNPVTGDIEFSLPEDGSIYGSIGIENDNIVLKSGEKRVSPNGFNDDLGSFTHDGDGQFRIDGEEGTIGLYSNQDFSEIDPTNKLIYAQRSYVEKPETLITALNNCDSTQLDEIKTILGII